MSSKRFLGNQFKLSCSQPKAAIGASLPSTCIAASSTRITGTNGSFYLQNRAEDNGSIGNVWLSSVTVHKLNSEAVRMTEAWSPLETEDINFVAQTRMDYIFFLEQMGEPPKVAFESRAGLEKWLSDEFENSEVQPILGGKNAVRVEIIDQRFTYLEQVWVKKSYGDYRKAMKYVADEFHSIRDLNALDADHVVARTILEDFSESWIAIFPTYKSSNSGFGSIERRLPKARKGFGSIELSPLAAFKVMNGKMPASTDDLNHALADIKGQIFSGRNNYLQDFICSMYDDVSKHIKDR